MKNSILYAVLILFVLSCSKDEKEYITNAGKIENAAIDSVFLVNDNLRKAVAIQNGKFSDTLKLKESGYFDFYAGRERTKIFLNPGDSLFISTDLNEFDEKLNYAGSSSNENNYLAQKYLKEESFSPNPQAFFSLPEKDYKAKVTELKSELEELLTKSETGNEFQQLEKKNIQFGYYLQLLQYPMAHEYFTQKQTDLPIDFDKELKKLDLENEADFLKIPNYREFVIRQFYEKIENAASPGKTEEIISAIKSAKIRDGIMSELLLYNVESGSPEAERYNDFIQKNANDEKLKEKAATAFAKVEKLLPGKPSPKFNYPDINGNDVSLDDLKGNLVYIDVWATWCGPCIREIPSLKQLEKDYHGKNIKFVSMSIDPQEDFDKWQKMVKEKNLQGIQVFADNDWKSRFVQEYGIKGIPRFILVDQNGNILNADAPRPSDSEIRTLIDRNL